MAPERIARVIVDSAPDIVALQEVDHGIPRTHHHDQTKLLIFTSSKRADRSNHAGRFHNHDRSEPRVRIPDCF